MFLPSGDDSIETSDCILPETTITFMYQSTNLSEFVIDVDIQGSRGQRVEGSVTLKDRTGYLADFVSSYNQTNSTVRAHNMTDARKVSLTLQQGTASISYPDLIPGDPQWDNDATLTWSFTDYTPIINLDNQNVGDYLYSEGDIVDSDDVIDDIADHIDQAISPDFTPYDIGTFRANESNILNALDELKTPVQAYNKWVGDVLHLETLTVEGTVMEIVDRFHIPREGGLTGSLSTGNLRTRFNYFKDKPLASSLGRAACTGKLLEASQCVGRVVQINFNRPTKHAIVRVVNVNKGTIEDGVFYDEAGEPLPSPDWFHFYGPAEATSWLGTYYPDFEVGPEVAYVPSWEVYAVGGTLSPEEESFEVYKTISEVESIYGARPEYRNMETELLRTEGDAQNFLDSLALEVVWSIRKFTLNTPFLIPGREGEFVGVTHYKHGLNSENCLINGWNHSYSIRDGWSNSYDLSALF